MTTQVKPEQQRQSFGIRLTNAIRALSPREQQIFWGSLIMFIMLTLFIGKTINNNFLVEVPKVGGTLIEGVKGAPQYINSVIAQSPTDLDLVALIYSGLMKKLPTGEIVPDIAKSYSVSEDGKTYTVILKDNLTWHDGSLISSADVLYTINAIQNDERTNKSPQRISWEGVKVEAVDTKTVVFTLPKPYAPFIEQLTVGLLPEHIWASVDNEQFNLSSFNRKPVGSGPYQIKSILEQADGIVESYTLERFSHYALGAPIIEQIEVRFYGSTDKLKSAFEAGEIDGFSDIPIALGRSLSAISNVTIHTGYVQVPISLYFNPQHASVLQDVNVRKALELAVDREVFVSDIQLGYGVPISGPLPPQNTSQFFKATTTLAERIEVAKTLLQKAGWTWDENDSAWEKKPKKAPKASTTPEILSIIISTGETPDVREPADLLKTQWEKLGIRVSVRGYDNSTLSKDIIARREFDALLFGVYVDRYPDLRPFWHSSQRNSPGSNLAQYVSQKADRYIESARGATTTAIRDEAIAGLLQEISNDVPAIFIYSPFFLYGTNSVVRGIELGPIVTRKDRFLGVTNWYMQTERVWPFFAKGKTRIVSSK